jgi:putative oxidoreductase
MGQEKGRRAAYARCRFPLQRLFSTFANGLPGKGLLVLRVAVVSFMIHNCMMLLNNGCTNFEVLLVIIWAIAGLLLLAGLWTPPAAISVAILHAWYLFSLPASSWDVFLGGAIAVGLALLGPGAYSADARLYGRKRIYVDE